MAVYQHFYVVYTGTDPTDAQTISQSFTAGTVAVSNEGPLSISDAVTASANISYAEPAKAHKVHYVVLSDSSATAAASSSFNAGFGVALGFPVRRRTDTKIRM